MLSSPVTGTIFPLSLTGRGDFFAPAKGNFMYSGTQANWHICSEDRKTVSFHHLLQTGIHCSNTSRKSVNLLFILGQHRTMGAAGFGGSFAPIVQYEKWEIHPVFPHFPYFRSGQNLSPNLLAPLCGVALNLSAEFASKTS